MKSEAATTKIHCRDALGNAVLVKLEQESDGQLYIVLTQFDGWQIVWQETIEVEELVAFILKRKQEAINAQEILKR